MCDTDLSITVLHPGVRTVHEENKLYAYSNY